MVWTETLTGNCASQFQLERGLLASTGGMTSNIKYDGGDWKIAEFYVMDFNLGNRRSIKKYLVISSEACPEQQYILAVKWTAVKRFF